MIRALDLCAGAGGLSLGLAAAGFQVLGVEKDKHAHATHVLNVGPCVLGDVRTFWPQPGFDLVAGGVPCQPYSDAGLRDGLNNPDGHLYKEVIRIALLTGAKAIMLENVKGLIHWNKGQALAQILDDLRRAGFVPEYRLIDCSEYGIPQARKRVIIIGTREGGGDYLARKNTWSGNCSSGPEPERGLSRGAFATIEVQPFGNGSAVYQRGPARVHDSGERLPGIPLPSGRTACKIDPGPGGHDPDLPEV